jgi:hypothetical protein
VEYIELDRHRHKPRVQLDRAEGGVYSGMKITSIRDNWVNISSWVVTV